MRIIYPGTLTLIQKFLCKSVFLTVLIIQSYVSFVKSFNVQIVGNPLLEGRTQLVESFHGKRAKILTSDANSIDTIFIDNRARSNGDILVICCEGNSGFYEIGMISTPIKAGYSALGWNHPGFAGSTVCKHLKILYF